MWILCKMNCVSLCISLKAKSNHLFLSKNLDHRKKSPHTNHSGTLPPDWKRTSCFSDLGETRTESSICLYLFPILGMCSHSSS